MVNQRLGYYLYKILPGVLRIISNSRNVMVVIDNRYVYRVLFILKMHHSLRMLNLLDIWAVDCLEQENRFVVNYMLVSVKYNIRIIIRTVVGSTCGLPSVERLFNGASWLEREVWDMFGVYFHENKDLRRILTDYGFEGHPLRKDFPLSGFVEVRYDDSTKVVVQEPIETSQAYRVFNFRSPWE